MDPKNYITLPISKEWAALFQSTPLLLLLAGVFAIVLYLAISKHWEWLQNRPNPLRWLAEHYVSFLLPLGFVAISLAIYFWIWDIRGEIGQIITLLDGQTDPTNIRNLAYAIGALLAAVALSATIPFQLIKVWVNERLAKTTEQGHMTDRITKAVEQLGAEKTIWEDGGQRTVPNMEVRLGAIYALERIAQDSIRDHIPVMEILCAYVRINSQISEAKESPHEVFRDLSASSENGEGLHPEIIDKSIRYNRANPFGWNPTELTPEYLEKWANWLPNPRIDIQAAITGIGRRKAKHVSAEENSLFKLDLSRCNLQKVFLQGNFDNCDFTETRFDGARIEGSLDGIHATNSSWQGARLQRVHCSNSTFLGANFNSAFCGGSTMNSCDFRYSKMHKTNFNGASVQQCDWYYAGINNVYFFENADASWGRFQLCKPYKLNGISGGPSKNLFVVESESREKLLPTMLYSGNIVSGNERSVFNAWQAAKAAANL